MKKRQLIPRGVADILIGLCCLFGSLAAFSLSTDKDQPIEVEADEAELDDKNDVSIYRGNVIVTQGSIRMTGDVMTVHSQGGEELDYLVIEGNPATYKQLPDDSTVHDQARARRMEYHESKNLVILIREAWVKQDTSTLVGERIEYNTELSRVKAWSRPDGEDSAAKAPAEQKSRVKLILKRKKDDASSGNPE